MYAQEEQETVMLPRIAEGQLWSPFLVVGSKMHPTTWEHKTAYVSTFQQSLWAHEVARGKVDNFSQMTDMTGKSNVPIYILVHVQLLENL